MDFGFYSLLPPLTAIALAVFTRRIILPLATGCFVGAVLLALGTTEAVSDLGSDGKVQVRFRSASSFLGVEPSVALIYDEIESGSPVSVEEMLFFGELLGTPEVVVGISNSPANEATVEDFLKEFNSKNLGITASLDPDDDAKTVIGRHADTEELEMLTFAPEWSVIDSKSVRLVLPTSDVIQTVMIQSPKIFFKAIYESVISLSHVQALIFSLLLAAMVGTLESGGGMRVLIERVSARIKTRRGAQTMIATSGLAVFFDDYANTLLLGGTMRSTADRYKLSRQKLAYFVDSTAAPVAGIALISTWTAIEISYISDGLASSGIDDPQAAFAMFLRSIPYRFYPWLALIMVFSVAILQRDFGPMLKSEIEADKELSGSSKPLGDKCQDDSRHLWIAAVLPVLLCLITVLTVLTITGTNTLADSQAISDEDGLIKRIGQILGNGDSFLALMVGGATGLSSAVLLHAVMGTSLKICVQGSIKGARQILPAMLILWFAWALSGMTEKDGLDTGGYLASLLSNQLPIFLLPSVVFILAGVMAFSTGTSWGTMGILTPLSVGLSIQMSGEPDQLDSSIVLATAGSVLAGAIFGDHCSPISDTTVFASRASGCDHISHVRTQMPYAILVGILSVVFGTLPAAVGVSPWLCLFGASIGIILVVRFLGKRVEDELQVSEIKEPEIANH